MSINDQFGFFFLLEFVVMLELLFLFFLPCLIILFGDRSLLLICDSLSKIFVFSKNLIILFIVPFMCLAISCIFSVLSWYTWNMSFLRLLKNGHAQYSNSPDKVSMQHPSGQSFSTVFGSSNYALSKKFTALPWIDVIGGARATPIFREHAYHRIPISRLLKVVGCWNTA